MVKDNDRFDTDRHGWAELLPARQARRPLTGRHRAPWVVVGAGLTGLACARRLAELHPDDEIILLEARQVGQGASGRNSGFAVAVSHFPGGYKAAERTEYARVNRINEAGLALLRQQVEEFGIDCQWHDSGIHHAAADSMAIAECGHYLDYLQAMEISHTQLDAEQLSARLGTAAYQTGVHVHDGALLQPAALVRGLADNLPDNVHLYEGSPVVAMQPGKMLRLELPNGSLRADKLLLATNYEVGQLGLLRRRLSASTLSGSFTRVLTADECASLGELKQWGILSLHGGGGTVRLTKDGRICLRNTAEFNGGQLLSDTELAERQAIHRASFDRRFPQLADVPFEFSWSGIEGISRNGTNFFGEQRDGLFFAGGYNGSGVSRGTAFGTALAEYASGGASRLIDDCLASAPAAWLPPRPFLDIGAALMVRSRFRGVGLDR